MSKAAILFLLLSTVHFSIYSETIYDLSGEVTEDSLADWVMVNFYDTRPDNKNATVCGTDSVANSILGGMLTFGNNSQAYKIYSFQRPHTMITLNITIYAIGSLNAYKFAGNEGHDDNLTITADDIVIVNERAWPRDCKPWPKSYYWRCGPQTSTQKDDVWNISVTFAHSFEQSNGKLKLNFSSSIDELTDEFYGWRDIVISTWECEDDCSLYGRQNITDFIMKPYADNGATCSYSAETSCDSNQFYRVDTYCYPCEYKCKKCISASNCIECLSPYRILDGFCAISCPTEQQYFNTDLNECLHCISNCQKCTTTTNCQTCMPEFGLQNNKCQRPCPDRMFFENDTCFNCSDHCASCLFQFDCLQCDDGYYKDQSTSQCQPCKSPCKFCTNSSDCQECFSPFVVLNNNCLDNCPDPYFLKDFKFCTKCLELCEKCSDLLHCTICNPIAGMLNGICQNPCPTKQFFKNNVCLPCKDHCSNCTNENDCSWCDEDQSLYEEKCWEQCPELTYWLDGYCKLCDPEKSICKWCNKPGDCQECVPGAAFLEGLCQNKCPLYYQKNDKNCSSCLSHCENCTNATECALCEIGYGYSNKQCLRSCPFAQQIDQNSRVCTPCNVSCITCSSPLRCIECNEGLIFLNGICYNQCPSQFYDNSGICQPCIDYCGNCSNGSNCLSCLSGQSLFNNTCASIKYSPLGYYYEKGEFHKCNESCLSCQNQSFCSGCKLMSVLLSNGLCSNNCSKGSFNYGGICRKCIYPCIDCNSFDDCLQCQIGFYLKEQNQQGICMSCDSTCGNMGCIGGNAEDCLNCKSSFVFYPQDSDTINRENNSSSSTIIHGKCWSTCPPNTYSNNSHCDPCDTLCATCSGPSKKECQSCDPPLYQQKKQCLDECPTGSVPNLKNECEDCAANCLKCTYGNKGKCSLCFPGQSLISSNECAPSQCDVNCVMCRENNICDACKSGWFLFAKNLSCLPIKNISASIVQSSKLNIFLIKFDLSWPTAQQLIYSRNKNQISISVDNVSASELAFDIALNVTNVSEKLSFQLNVFWQNASILSNLNADAMLHARLNFADQEYHLSTPVLSIKQFNPEKKSDVLLKVLPLLRSTSDPQLYLFETNESFPEFFQKWEVMDFSVEIQGASADQTQRVNKRQDEDKLEIKLNISGFLNGSEIMIVKYFFPTELEMNPKYLLLSRFASIATLPYYPTEISRSSLETITLLTKITDKATKQSSFLTDAALAFSNLYIFGVTIALLFSNSKQLMISFPANVLALFKVEAEKAQDWKQFLFEADKMDPVPAQNSQFSRQHYSTIGWNNYYEFLAKIGLLTALYIIVSLCFYCKKNQTSPEETLSNDKKQLKNSTTWMIQKMLFKLIHTTTISQIVPIIVACSMTLYYPPFQTIMGIISFAISFVLIWLVLRTLFISFIINLRMRNSKLKVKSPKDTPLFFLIIYKIMLFPTSKEFKDNEEFYEFCQDEYEFESVLGSVYQFFSVLRFVLFAVCIVVAEQQPMMAIVLTQIISLFLLLISMVKRPFKEVLFTIQNVAFELINTAFLTTLIALQIMDVINFNDNNRRLLVGNVLLVLNLLMNWVPRLFLIISMIIYIAIFSKNYCCPERIRRTKKALASQSLINPGTISSNSLVGSKKPRKSLKKLKTKLKKNKKV